MTDYWYEHLWPLPVFVLGMIFLFAVGARQVDHHYTARNCPKQAIAYNRQTKFVDYNFWNYECLVRTSKNNYVPVNKLINNVQE